MNARCMNATGIINIQGLAQNQQLTWVFHNKLLEFVDDNVSAFARCSNAIITVHHACWLEG